MTAIPETDSAIWAVIDAIVSRTRRKATCERTWNQRVRMSVGGRMTSATSAEAPVEDEEPDDRREQRQRVDDERRQALGEDVRERVDVRGDPGDDPAGLLLREVLQRQSGQVVEEVFAQSEHHVLADSREPAYERRLEDPGEGIDDEIDDDVPGQPGLVVRLHSVVDRVLHDEQCSDRRRCGADSHHRQEPDAQPATGQVAAEPRQPGAPFRRGPGGRLRVPQSLVDPPPMQPH